MQVCRTCRHWADDGYPYREQRIGYGHCRRIDFTFQQSFPKSGAPLAALYDPGGDVAVLATMADFGCALHDPSAVDGLGGEG